MKKLRKRTNIYSNTLEKYVWENYGGCVCSCYCGPGGFPWREARDSTSVSAYYN